MSLELRAFLGVLLLAFCAGAFFASLVSMGSLEWAAVWFVVVLFNVVDGYGALFRDEAREQERAKK